MTADPFDDQFDAAANEALKMFNQANSRLDTIERECGEGSMGARIGQRFFESLDAPTSKHCPHLVGGPQPVYAASNLPGLIGCADCMTPLIKTKQIIEKLAANGRVCDSCGDRVDKWHDSLIQRGPLLLLATVCCFCMQMSEFEHDPEAH